jgi:VIT1/CCC1 family predicted Fe2+/Mn2+ transporter
MISRLFPLLLMIFLEDVVTGTFLSIFIVFFCIDIFNSAVGRVSNINTFFKIKGNFTQPISKT